MPPSGAFQLNIQALGRLRSVEEFADIVVATNEGGAPLRLRDVARMELGAQDYTLNAYLDTDKAVAMPDLPATRIERAGHRGRAAEHAGGAEARLPAGPRLPHRL